MILHVLHGEVSSFLSAQRKKVEESWVACDHLAMPCEIPVTSVEGHLAWFQDMVDHCYDYAEAAKAQGRPMVGILCEFTPRELILAAGGIPVCL